MMFGRSVLLLIKAFVMSKHIRYGLMSEAVGSYLYIATVKNGEWNESVQFITAAANSHGHYELICTVHCVLIDKSHSPSY